MLAIVENQTDVDKYDLDKETLFIWMVDYEVAFAKSGVWAVIPIIKQL